MRKRFNVNDKPRDNPCVRIDNGPDYAHRVTEQARMKSREQKVTKGQMNWLIGVLGLGVNCSKTRLGDTLKVLLGWNNLTWKEAILRYFIEKPVLPGFTDKQETQSKPYGQHHTSNKKPNTNRKKAKKRRQLPLPPAPNHGLPKAYISSPEFLQSYEWRVIRMQALKLYGAKCACCGATPASGAVMNVDHIKPRKVYPELALCLENLQVLCHECNHGKGNWDATDWRAQSKQ
jgi:5-methylcytosine-specific restriction endonuclease McrA